MLRTQQHPWGVLNMSASDSIKVRAANQLYKQLAAFLHQCNELGVLHALALAVLRIIDRYIHFCSLPGMCFLKPGAAMPQELLARPKRHSPGAQRFATFWTQKCLHAGTSRHVLARANRQPRGRLRPQLVSEYLRVTSVRLPALPALDSKRCLSGSVRHIPAGSKLLRFEKQGDGSVLCIFGLFRSTLMMIWSRSHQNHMRAAPPLKCPG